MFSWPSRGAVAVASCSFASLDVRPQHFADPVALNTSLCHIPARSHLSSWHYPVMP